MYIARFCYEIAPINRQRAIELIRREVETARANNQAARLLIPLTRAHGAAALQFEVELTNLDQLDHVRHRGAGPEDQTGNWMREFSEILTAPPIVEIFRVD
jgi:hypothetical protein